MVTLVTSQRPIRAGAGSVSVRDHFWETTDDYHFDSQGLRRRIVARNAGNCLRGRSPSCPGLPSDPVLGGVIPVAPFSMMPTVPFGVPEVISSSFWGGVWGIVFVLTLPRFFRGISYWLASAITGGVALTLVYMFVVVPLKTGAMPPDMVGLLSS